MKKKYISLALLYCLPTSAREIRTPYAASMSRTYHQAVVRNPQEERSYFEPWASYHNKRATHALDTNGKKTPISTLLFNTSEFTALDLVSPITRNTLDETTKNLLRQDVVSLPNVQYQENGGHFGFIINKRFTRNTRAGIRTTIPVKRIAVTNCNQPPVSDVIVYLNPDQITGCPCSSGNIIGKQIYALTQTPEVQSLLSTNSLTLDEVCVRSGADFAYRLDFVSLLPANPALDPLTPLMLYGTAGASPMNDTYIGSEDITNQIDSPSVNVIRRNDYTPPPFPYGVLNTTNFIPLNGSGTNLENNERGDFQPASSGTDYTPLKNSPATQKLLWITPSFDSNTVFVNQNPLTDFSFQSVNTIGLGDMDIECYVNHTIRDFALVEGRLGIRAPTGKRLICPTSPCNDKKLVLQLPAGSDHHTEVHIGGAFAWRPVAWFNFYADSMYSAVLQTREVVFAPFYDMCVKNIGPCTCANVSWSYQITHLQLTLCNPETTPVGFHLDYQLYTKQRDSVHFMKTKTKDLLQNNVSLDPLTIEKHTDVRANTLHAEFFCTIAQKMHLFAGASYVVGGKNAMQETDVYVGLSVTY